MIKRILALSFITALALGVVMLASPAAVVEAQTPGPYPEVDPVYVNGSYIAGSCTQNGFAVNFGTILQPSSRYSISMAVFEAQAMDNETTGKLPNRLANNPRGLLNSLTGAAVTLDTYTGDLIALRVANQLTTPSPIATFTIPFGQFPLTGDDAGAYTWTGGTVHPYTALNPTGGVVPSWDVIAYLSMWPKYGVAGSASYTAYGIDCWPDGPAPAHTGRVRITSIWSENAQA